MGFRVNMLTSVWIHNKQVLSQSIYHSQSNVVPVAVIKWSPYRLRRGTTSRRASHTTLMHLSFKLRIGKERSWKDSELAVSCYWTEQTGNYFFTI